MASSSSGQDEPNRTMWLATWAGKMEPSYPLMTTRCIPQEKYPQKPYNKSFINQVCSVKMAEYWPLSFFASLWTISVHKHVKKVSGQYPAILTSHLVNNPYILTSCLVNNPKYVETSPYRHLFNTDTISITEKRTFSSGGGGVHILVSSSFYITLQYIFYTCIPWQWSVSARACCVQSYWYSVLITE